MSPEFEPDFQEDRYFTEKLEAIEAGKNVWCRRNFATDLGAVYDYFSNRTHHGFVDAEGDGNFRTYYITHDGETIAVGDRFTLNDAQFLLLDIVDFENNS